jgi:anti-anti-sigma factor
VGNPATRQTGPPDRHEEKGTPVLDIRTTGSGDVTVVVRGELDLRHAPDLRAAITALLNRGDVTDIDLDISGVTSVDASGLGTVIVAHRVAAGVGVDLRITAVSPLTGRLLHLLGADHLVPAPRTPERLPQTTLL